MATSSLFSHLPLPGKPLTSIPALVYGTAWKKDLTNSLVTQALQNGFTAIDTACQPRHYREDLVGEGLRKFLSSPTNTQKCKRSDLYIQTKFTSIHGQDPNNMPYDSASSIPDQIHQSIATSLRNFTTSSSEQPYLDALILHSPFPTMDETLLAWQTLETYVPDKIHHLGISNTHLSTLMELYERATVKPSIVQNRFYPSTKHDIAVRKFCAERGMIYQSFWTITANPGLLKSKVVAETVSELGISHTGALYVLVLGLGNTVILNGTTSIEHMREDWEAVRKAKEYAETSEEKWKSLVRKFRETIGEAVD